MYGFGRNQIQNWWKTYLAPIWCHLTILEFWFHSKRLFISNVIIWALLYFACVFLYRTWRKCISGQIIIFHQPGNSWNKGNSLTKPPFGVRSCEVAIIWPDVYPSTKKKTGLWYTTNKLMAGFVVRFHAAEPEVGGLNSTPWSLGMGNSSHL